MAKTLPSLFPEVVPVDTALDVVVEMIDVNDYVDPTPDFIESVRRFGIIQPVLLCRDKDRYKVLAGRRRVLSAKLIGMTTIKAIVREGISYSDAQASALTIEAQKKFNENPVAELRAIQSLIKDGYQKEAIMSALGLSGERIDKVMKLGSLPEELLDAVQERKVSITTAKTLAKMSAPYQKKAIKTFESNGKLTGSDLSEIKTAQKKSSVQDVMKAMEVSKSHEPTLSDQVAQLWKNDTKSDSKYDSGWNDALAEVLKLLS